MRFIHARVFTNAKEGPLLLEDAALRVEGTKITEIGKTEDLAKNAPADEEVIDLKGKLLLPGLLNCHTHIYSAFARGMGVSRPTRNFMEILENLWWALDKKLTAEDAKLCAYFTMIESIKNGVTCLIDHHAAPNGTLGSLDQIAEAALELGIRADLCYELSDRDGDQARDLGLEENIRFIRRCQEQPNDLLRAHFGLHASFTLSDESLEKAARAVQELGAGVHVHCAEGLDDETLCLRQHGCRVLERLERFGLLNEKSLVAHLCHASARELDILKASGATALHNPGSNMNNAVGRTPLTELLKRGIRTGLGTDAYTHDMFDSLKTAKILHPHDLADPTVGFAESLQLLFGNNPEIVSDFFGQSIGRIEVGAEADLAIFDYVAYTPINDASIKGHLLFGLQGRQCTDTMVAGRFIYRDRRIVGVDEAQVAALCQKRAAEIWPLM